MEINQTTTAFLSGLMEEIAQKDRVHSKKINANVDFLVKNYPAAYEELVELVRIYFSKKNLPTARITDDYLKMIRDMRAEGMYFYKNGKYRCDNQHIANEYVYSKPEVMTYYMNALLLSQILWKHHFNMFMYFKSNLETQFKSSSRLSILDVGPGHGFFSFLIKKQFPDYKKIDIVDISVTSLEMTQTIIGHDNNKIQYFNSDIFDFSEENKYDFIVLGEVLEHLDNPLQILVKLGSLLNPSGLLWVTTPTNSPALDHVYLFKTKEEVLTLVAQSGLTIVDSCSFFAEDMDEQAALKNKITNLVGLFAKKI